MALIITPGAADADSYTSLAEATTYFTARGITEWTGTDTVKENALRRATTYLDNQYRGRWRGIRYAETQVLAWPRVEGYRGLAGGMIEPLLDLDGFAIGYDVVPLQVKHATLEAALLRITGVVLEPRLERGGAIKSISEQVGPISTSITYSDGASVVDRFTAIEGLLRGLVNSTPGASFSQMQIVRG